MQFHLTIKGAFPMDEKTRMFIRQIAVIKDQAAQLTREIEELEKALQEGEKPPEKKGMRKVPISGR